MIAIRVYGAAASPLGATICLPCRWLMLGLPYAHDDTLIFMLPLLILLFATLLAGATSAAAVFRDMPLPLGCRRFTSDTFVCRRRDLMLSFHLLSFML